jgi:hypothetical protein
MGALDDLSGSARVGVHEVVVATYIGWCGRRCACWRPSTSRGGGCLSPIARNTRNRRNHAGQAVTGALWWP